MITPDQIRAARALKNWNQAELAERTGLSVPSIANIELDKQKPSATTLDKIYTAFDAAEIIFSDNEGVRRKKNSIQVLKGKKGFNDFLDDVYETVKEQGGDICGSNVDGRDWKKWIGEEGHKRHRKRLNDIKDQFKSRILVKEGDWFFLSAEFSEYRWIPEEHFSSVPFYVYGNKLVIILFLDEPLIFLIHSEEAAQAYREKFSISWEQAIIPHK